MEILSLIARAYSAGLKIFADGSQLVIRGPRRAEVIATDLISKKEEVLNVLGSVAEHDLNLSTQDYNNIVVPPTPPEQEGFVTEWAYVDGNYRWRYRRKDIADRVIARPVHGTERATSDVFVGERVVFGYVRPWLGIPRDGA